MSLFADKYQPTSLSNIDYGAHVSKVLYSLAHSDQLPHLIIEGARGSGKKVRANLFLKEKYGTFNTNRVLMHLKIPGKTEEKELHTLASRYHYQLNPNIHNIYDRTLMQSFIDAVVQCEIISSIPYRIIIIEDADLLTIEAQESLRKTLETYIHTCRFIFLSNREGHIIDPLYSRCVKIEINSPLESEIKSILSNISKDELSGTDMVVPDEIYNQIIHGSQRDLSRALRYFEKYIMRIKCGLDPKFDIRQYDSVYNYCCQIIDTIISGTDIVGTMDNVRSYLYELVNYCTDNKELLAILLDISLSKIPKTCHTERFLLCNMASVRDESIRQSSKSVYHVEGFCLYIFGIIKTLMERPSTGSSAAKQKTVVKKKI
jgi:replication factor C subunit 3/5